MLRQAQHKKKHCSQLCTPYTAGAVIIFAPGDGAANSALGDVVIHRDFRARKEVCQPLLRLGSAQVPMVLQALQHLAFGMVQVFGLQSRFATALHGLQPASQGRVRLRKFRGLFCQWPGRVPCFDLAQHKCLHTGGIEPIKFPNILHPHKHARFKFRITARGI